MSSTRIRPATPQSPARTPLVPSAQDRKAAIGIPTLAGAVALATVATGLGARAAGVELGTPLPPFIQAWSPHVDAALAVALVAIAIGIGAAPALLRRPLHPAAFAAVVGALCLALVLSLAASHHGIAGWYEVFDFHRSFEAKNEYLPALPALGYGVRFFLDRFAELVPALPVHAAGHPPGLLLTIRALGITTAPQLAALCIAATAMLAPLTYVVARRRLPEPRARAAALLVAFSPVAAVIGVSSADAIYAALGMVAAIGLLGAGRQRVAGAAALAVASFFSWALIAVGGIAVLAELRGSGLRRAAILAAFCAAALVAFYAALYAATGFDPIGAIRATHRVYDAGIASLRPYPFWLFGSPVAFGVAIGLPVALYALRALAAAEPLALAVAAIVLAASVLGLTKAETERIWLFLMPFAALAAATTVPLHRLRVVLGALAAQALATELLFVSAW
jgi:methylthioxylose transferase